MFENRAAAEYAERTECPRTLLGTNLCHPQHDACAAPTTNTAMVCQSALAGGMSRFRAIKSSANSMDCVLQLLALRLLPMHVAPPEHHLAVPSMSKGCCRIARCLALGRMCSVQASRR